jgi:hypothetical protein
MASGLEAAGHQVRVVDTTPLSRPGTFSPSWWALKSSGRLFPDPGDTILVTAERIVRDWRPDVLFCFKTVRLDQERLLAMDVPRKVHYSPDDVSNPDNVSADYLKHEKSWSLVVTTKKHNVEEVRGRMGSTPLFVWSAYDPAWHHPEPLVEPYGQYVAGFIGNARPDRRALMLRLSHWLGKSFLVAGERWVRTAPALVPQASVRGALYGEAFSSAVRSVIGNLVLLNSANRDSHTCRSFEVPAAGGLVLAQRTEDHLELLEEGREALFFSTEEELVEVIERVRRRPEAFEDMRRRGHERIVRGKHTYQDRAAQIMDHLGS